VKIRRQAQALKVQEDRIADLSAKVANLTAAIGAILEYVNPERGEWVSSPDAPPEYEEYEPRPRSYAEYTALLFQVPAEVVRDGR